MKTPHPTPRRKLLLLAAGASVLVLLGAAAGVVVLLSGAFSTAATKQHFAITYWILDTGLRYSVRASADGIQAPPLNDPAMRQRGLSCYRAHCAQCHGAPGISRDDEGKGLLPIPGNLAQSAREWPAAWLYYVTKKGVRMAGMPAWEYRLSEDSLWSTVAFLKTLPFLTREQYAERAAVADFTACTPSNELPDLPADERGKVVLRQYACHSCHKIDDVVGPDTFVGPPLTGWPHRKYIAGVLPNTPENLRRWIREPQSISPDTLMPDLNVADAHAREMAAYLFRTE